ncbi:PPOX class F420-dependent oxidoreductase [Spirillospora sp. NPDC127200]
MANDEALRKLVQDRNLGVLATVKKDGRPQLSNINYTYDPARALVRISVTDGRAKTRNLRRDPRASLHVSAPDGWSWAVAEGTAELVGPAREEHDAVVEELIDLYRAVRGEEHPDWDDYRRAMVADRRVALHLHVERLYGHAGA